MDLTSSLLSLWRMECPWRLASWSTKSSFTCQDWEKRLSCATPNPSSTPWIKHDEAWLALCLTLSYIMDQQSNESHLDQTYLATAAVRAGTIYHFNSAVPRPYNSGPGCLGSLAADSLNMVASESLHKPLHFTVHTQPTSHIGQSQVLQNYMVLFFRSSSLRMLFVHIFQPAPAWMRW